MSPAMKPKAETSVRITSACAPGDPIATRAVSTSGCFDEASAVPNTPCVTVCSPMYSSAIMTIAMASARGIVRAGLFVSPETLSADSMPTNAKKRMSVASPILPAVGSSVHVRLPGTTKKAPTMINSASGTNFRKPMVMVSQLPSRVPMMLMSAMLP